MDIIVNLMRFSEEFICFGKMLVVFNTTIIVDPKWINIQFVIHFGAFWV